jgi:hypothetical protein
MVAKLFENQGQAQCVRTSFDFSHSYCPGSSVKQASYFDVFLIVVVQYPNHGRNRLTRARARPDKAGGVSKAYFTYASYERPSFTDLPVENFVGGRKTQEKGLCRCKPLSVDAKLDKGGFENVRRPVD